MTGWTIALAVGNASSGTEFVFPASEEMGHPIKGNPLNPFGRSTSAVPAVWVFGQGR